MSLIYQLSLDNVAPGISIPLAMPYVQGSGTLILQSGSGLPAPPFRLTVVTAASQGTGLNEVLTVFKITGVSGSTLSITYPTLENSVDQNFSIGDLAQIRDQSGAITDLNNAVEAITPTIYDSLTAAGTNQGTATALFGPCSINRVTTVASGTGVILPVIVLPTSIAVSNNGANDLSVYPPTGGTIGNNAVNLPVSVPVNTTIIFNADNATNYCMVGGGSGGGGSGTVTQVNTGTGLTGGPIVVSGTISVADSTANTLAGYSSLGHFSDVAVGSGLSLSSGTLSATGSGGSVTSVAMTGDGTVFQTSVSGSPITTSGTLVPALVLQTANTFLSGPASDGPSAPTFRAFVTADFPAGVISNASLANSSVTISGHSLSLGGSLNLVSSDVGLSSVTNNLQTRAAIVPNTAPGSGQILVGNSGGTAYVPQSVSGDVSLTFGGIATVASIGGEAVTLGGSLTTSGAFGLTLTLTGTTNVTLPTSGTLLAGNQTITLSGDTTGSGTTAITTTTSKVNGVSFPSGPSTNTVPVVTGVNAVTYEAVPNAALANSSITISGHVVSLGGSQNLVAADVGLGSVTNDVQTKASIVPNTLPAAGDILVGNAGGTAYAHQAVSGSGATITLSSAGVFTISAIANASLSNSSLTVTAGAGLSGGGSVSLGGSTSLSVALFTRTTVKTGAYNAQPNDLVPVDVSSGSVTITLPTAPANRTLIAVKLITVSGANTCTVAAGGSDVFNKAAGSTTLTLNATNQSVSLEYDSGTSIWTVIGSDNSTGAYAAGSNITITTSGGTRTIASTGGISALTGDVSASGTGSVAARVIGLTNAISVSVSSNNVNNWAPTGISTANRIKITASATGTSGSQMPNITGISYSGVTDGQILILENIGTFTLRLDANSGSSSAGNQFIFAENYIYLQPNDAISIVWDSTSNGWLHVERAINVSHTYFGSGFDGNVAISSGTTTLTRDTYYQNLTISGTGSLNTGGYRVYVSEVLDISAAPANAITRSGNVGSNASSSTGASGGGGSGIVSRTIGGGISGGSGAAGATGTGGNAASSALSTNALNTNTATSGNGGAGGTGGAGSGTAPGVGNIVNGNTYKYLETISLNSSLVLGAVAGAGGGGGGGDGTNAGGGGGGGGAGGVVGWVAARTIYRGSNATTGIITYKGAAGGNGFTPTVGNAGGGGGGSGGAGGWFLMFYAYLAGSTITSAIDVSGGNGGTGGNLHGSGANGVGGAQGNGGRVNLINVVTNVATENGTVGQAGGAASGTTGGSGVVTQVNL